MNTSAKRMSGEKMEEMSGHLPKLAETLPEWQQGEKNSGFTMEREGSAPSSPQWNAEQTDKWADEGGNIRTPIHLKPTETTIRAEDEKLVHKATSTTEASKVDIVATKLQIANAQTAAWTASVIEGAREKANTMVEKTLEGKDFMLEKAKLTKDFTIEKAAETKDFIGAKAAQSKDLIVEKAQSSKEFAVEKASLTKEILTEKVDKTKEVITEKSVEGKQLVLQKADQSKQFLYGSYEGGKKFFSEKMREGRQMFYQKGTYFLHKIDESRLWMYRKSLETGHYMMLKVEQGRQWMMELMAPFLITTLQLTHNAAERGKSGMEYVSAKTELLEKSLEEKTETPTPMVNANITTYYTTLNSNPADKAAEAQGYEPLKGTQEEIRGLIHQE